MTSRSDGFDAGGNVQESVEKCDWIKCFSFALENTILDSTEKNAPMHEQKSFSQNPHRV